VGFDLRHSILSVGFTGSAGTAVVTMSNALLWTDSRYYLQASIQLNKTYWRLIKDVDGSIVDYLGNEPAVKRVCQDPRFISIGKLGF